MMAVLDFFAIAGTVTVNDDGEDVITDYNIDFFTLRLLDVTKLAGILGDSLSYQSYVVDRTAETGTVYGTDLSDELLLSEDVTEAYGFGGNDVIELKSIAQKIMGGAGRNRLLANEFNFDNIENSQINLGDYENMQDITSNIKTITGDDKNNLIDARTNTDFLLASIEGLGGNDIIHAGSGRNTVHGGEGHDAIFGYAGNDTLYGENGNDRLFGGIDNDILIGGAGHDRLVGGAGDDVFQYYHYQSGKQTLFLEIEDHGYENGHPKLIAFERDAPDSRNLNHQIELPDGTQSPYSSLLYSGHMTITDFGNGNDLLYFSNISLFNELPDGTDRADDATLPASLFYQKYRLDDDDNEIEVTDDSGHDFIKIFGRFDFAAHHAPDIFQTNSISQDTFLLAILENYSGELELDAHIVTALPLADL